MTQYPQEYDTGAIELGEPSGSTVDPTMGTPAMDPTPQSTIESSPYPTTGPTIPTSDRPTDTSGTTADTAKEQAAEVKDSAQEAAGHVAGVAKDQAAEVAQEAKNQARDLLSRSRDELVEQSAQQQQRVAGGLHTLSHELRSMADRSEDPGYATDLVREAADRSHSIATWLEQREPGQLVDEVKAFARERPGAFLGIAAAAGLVAGRLGRGLKDSAASEDVR